VSLERPGLGVGIHARDDLDSRNRRPMNTTSRCEYEPIIRQHALTCTVCEADSSAGNIDFVDIAADEIDIEGREYLFQGHAHVIE
jgi:hypothetical protein